MTMNVLAIDTATDHFSVALAAGHNTWLFEADAGLRHSELIMDSIDMLFKTAALKPEELNGVVCMGGPGSFTGLRIGYSTAKGLALSLGIPFAPIPTLDCLARPFSSLPGIFVPVLDAKRKAFFCALYREGNRLCPDMDEGPVEIVRTIAAELSPQAGNAPEQALLFGPGAELLYDRIAQLQLNDLAIASIKLGKLRWGNAATMLEMAREKDIFANSNEYNFAGPEYIRKSDAEEEARDKR